MELVVIEVPARATCQILGCTMNRGLKELTVATVRILLVVGAASGTLAYAQPGVLGAAIAANGTAAGAAACAGCHGATGEGIGAAGFPRLAGLQPAYIVAQLDQFAAGTRQNAVMAAVAKQLTPAERLAVAAYYGAMAAAPALAAQDVTALKRSDNGAWLALRGRWENSLPACIQCHGPGGVGVGATFPALAGQSSTYIETQLHAFKTGTRRGGPFNLMTVVATRLSDADMSAVAAHFGTTAPAALTPGPSKEKK